MSSRLAFVALVLVALMIGIGSRAPEAQAQAARSGARVASFTGSVSATNAAITSTVGSNDVLVIRSLVAVSNAAGTLTITDGTGGVALARFYLAANTPVTITPDVLGPAGIRCSRGTTPYANAISSATALTLTMSVSTE